MEGHTGRLMIGHYRMCISSRCLLKAQRTEMRVMLPKRYLRVRLSAGLCARAMGEPPGKRSIMIPSSRLLPEIIASMLELIVVSAEVMMGGVHGMNYPAHLCMILRAC